jgi:hypothetical protein
MDVFVRDMQTGITTRVSGAGAQGNGASFAAAISLDGRFVSFSSAAMNFASDDTNNAYDVFLARPQTRTTGAGERQFVGSMG